MKTEFVGRRVELKTTFCDKAKKRVEKLQKFFSPDAVAHITVTVDKNHQTVEATIKDGAMIVRAEKSADRMETALEIVFDIITKRIVKNKRKLEQRLHSNDFDELVVPENTEEFETSDIFEISREKRIMVKPCTIEEAILEMNLLGHEFYVFSNATTGGIEVCYRRKNGTYGILIPENN